MPRALRGLRSLIVAMSEPRMADSFAAQLADALEASWPAIARPNQLPPPGDWANLVAACGPGFWQDPDLGGMGVPAGGIRPGRQDRPGRGHRRRCARCLGRRTKRHPGGIAALVPAGLRALETKADLAQWGHCDDF